MSLIKIQGLPVFKQKSGFKYPHFWEYYKLHDRLHWTAEEISLSEDVKHFNQASDDEREFIISTMRLFTQNEVQVGHGYATMMRIFKPTEVLAWLANANAREYTHIENYSLFTETIGIGDSIYTEFLDIPVMSTKCEYLEKAKVKKYEDYKSMGLTDAEVSKEYRRSIARMIAVYAGGTENISLMAQFASLLAFQFQNKYPGLCNIVEFSLKEESLHGTANSHLFRDFIAENQDIWDDELKFDIYEGIREVVAYEHALIDYLNPPHMNKDDLKRYVEYCGDNALKELGMKANWNISKNPLPFMDDVVGTVITDFFSGRVTEYSKQFQGDWDAIKYSHWSE